jgi:hypothetical protein
MKSTRRSTNYMFCYADDNEIDKKIDESMFCYAG